MLWCYDEMMRMLMTRWYVVAVLRCHDVMILCCYDVMVLGYVEVLCVRDVVVVWCCKVSILARLLLLDQNIQFRAAFWRIT